MTFAVSLDTWARQQQAAGPIRVQVFVVEQQVPADLEWDEWDAQSLHAVATCADGQPVGTGRLLPDGHIGRMAVLPPWRSKGVGGALLHALMTAARKRGDHEVVLHAQIQAEPFYRRFGFAAEGAVFEEAGIAHRVMRCRFPEQPEPGGA